MLFIGPFPSPVHGQSLATKHIHDYFLDNGINLRVVNISGNLLKKIIMHLYACFMIFFFNEKSIYISLNSNNGLILDLFIVIIARIKKTSIFLHYHAYDHIRRNSWTLRVLGKLAGKKCQHIVLGHKMLKDLRNCIGEDKRIIILNNSKLIKESSVINNYRNLDKVRLGHLSNLTIEKGLRTTIDLAIYLDQYFEIELFLAGPIQSDEVDKEIRKAKDLLGDNLKYLGPVYDEDKNKFYSQINFFVFPSSYKNEAAPLVVLESLAAGVPVIASNIGCIIDSVGKNGGIVLEINSDFPELVYRYINDIVQNKSYEGISKNATSQFKILLEESQKKLDEIVVYIKKDENI